MSTIKMKYKIETDKEYGRHLVAVDDIKAGEIILNDLPIVIGPKTKSDLVCFNCNKSISKRFNCCNMCKVAPLCENTCEQNKGWHSDLECKLFSSFNGQLTFPKLIEDLNVITIIRCLLLRHKKESDDWNRFIDLHCDHKERKDLASTEAYKKSAKLLRELKVITEDGEDLESIRKICCILDVNCFELRLEQSSNSNHESICGIYPTATLMAHSCIANTHVGIDDDFKMVVRASVAIPQSTRIFFNYTNILEGTIKRREHVRESKYFQCKCIRCRDSTELGIHMSTLRCKHCENGLIIMVKPLKCTKLSKDDKWYCTHCQRKYIKEEINCILKEVLDLFAHVDNTNPKSIEEFISVAQNKLHSNHYIILEAKHQLAGLLREILNRTTHPLKKMMLRKLEICKDFIPILNVLEPGISRLKGITLYELHIPIVQLANKDHDAKEITSSEYLDRLTEAENYLKEAIRLLLYEPMSTPEGKLCKRAMDELRMLQKAKDEAKVINEVPVTGKGQRMVKNRKK